MAYDIFHNYGLDKIKDNHSLNENYTPREWRVVSSKSVVDSDGFMTDYTWYTDGVQHIFMFGDSDFNEPDSDYADWVCDSEQEAQEWFDSYNGFDEYQEDEIFFLDECSVSKEEFFDKGFKDAYGIEADDEKSLQLRGDILTEAYNNLPSWFTDFLDNSIDGKSIKKILSNRGIDLANATYIKGVFPRSNRDPVLKDESRLTIFRLDDGRSGEKIYIVGVNNPWLHLPGSWDSKYANDLPMKTILSMATEYGYIDTNDSRNSNKDKRAERAALRRIDVAGPQRGVGQHPVEHKIYATDEYGRKDWTNVIGTEIEWVMTKGQDKSGYPLDPEKYVKMLDKVGLDTYAARLESYYKKIESVRTRLIALFDKFDANDSDKYRTYGSFSRNVHEDIAEAMNSWSRAIKSYQTLKNQVAEIVARHEEAPSERTDERIQHAFAWEGKSFRDYLKDAVDLISNIEKTERLPDRD